jgi:hypothetical protein
MGFAPFTHIVQAIFALTYNQVGALQNNNNLECPDKMMTEKLFHIEMEALCVLIDTMREKLLVCWLGKSEGCFFPL